MRFACLLIAVATGGAACTLIDDFDRFKSGPTPMDASADAAPPSAADAACTFSCRDRSTLVSSCGAPVSCPCLDGNDSAGLPAHCTIVASNSLVCAGPSTVDVVLAPGDYVIDTGVAAPTLSGPNLKPLLGSVANGNALFCLRSLTTQAGAAPTLTVQGPLKVALLVDDVVTFTGSLFLNGGDSRDENGGTARSGGAPGGTQQMMGGGTAGGSAGSSTPGTGGGGAGGAGAAGSAPANLLAGSGGSSSAGASTPGGAGSVAGFVGGSGGGGGGQGSNKGGGGGAGGGAMQITASWSVQLNGRFDASGGGAGGGGAAGGGSGGGGGGGGAGGTILIEAPTVSLGANACLTVVGGSGGAGGGLARGGDALNFGTCPFGTRGGVSALAAGGDFGTHPNGANAANNNTGGGGGAGGYGRVVVRSRNRPDLTNAVFPGVAALSLPLP